MPYDDLNYAVNYTRPALTGSFSFPVLDGDFNRNFGSVQLAAGQFVHVPIIAGANGDEGVSFGVRGINSSDEFLARLQSLCSCIFLSS